MAVSTLKAGPYYVSGEIKFSDLRRDFRNQQRRESSGVSETFIADASSINSSELLRTTDVTVTDPVVPDCTENRTSGPLNTGISTDNNLSFSQFRNSIKYYYLVQSGTDENLAIDEQDWNSNLDKNINTFVFINGTCGSNNPSSPALSINVTTNNLAVEVSGNIYGASGRGGGTSGAPSVNGETGGDAISISNPSGNNTIISVKSGAKIYAGGGGGEKGNKGRDGNGGRCRETTRVQSGCQQGNTANCPGGWNQYNSGNWCCEWRRGCNASIWWRECERYYNTSGGTGGAGGNGGLGRGYANISGSLSGSPGSGGSGGGGCGAQNGGTGETGGSGGNWASGGGNTSNSGNGGSAGKAITGSGYSVTGTLNSDTIKGTYL